MAEKDEKKKTEAEIDKERKEKAKQRALDKLAEEDLRKERKKKEEEEKRNKQIEINKKCKKSETEYFIKFNYKCRAVCGNEYMILNNNKRVFPFIDKDDSVLYKNVEHVNHKKKAIVIDYNLQGTGKENISEDKQKPVFDIKFTDPIEQLPFYKTVVDGVTINTKQKIIIIKRVKYDDLELIYSKKKGDSICIKKSDGTGNIDINNPEYLKMNYNKPGNTINAKYNFNKFIFKIFKKDIPDYFNKLNKNQDILLIELLKGKSKKKTKIKINQSNLKKYFTTLEKFREKLKKDGKLLKVNQKAEFNDNITKLKAIFNHFDNNDKNKMQIYIYIYFYLRDIRKKIQLIMEKKDITGNDSTGISKIYNIYNKLISEFEIIKEYFFTEYSKLFDLDKENDDETEYIKKNIINIVNKNRADIHRNNIKSENELFYKKYQVKDYIIDEIKKLVKKYFQIGKEFIPEKVFLKYANKELIELDEKEREREEEEEEAQSKLFFKTSNTDKLVKPTPDKIFTITHIDDIFMEDNNSQKFWDENIIKSNQEENLFEVMIDVGLNVQDKKTKEKLFEDKKTGKTTFIDMIGNVVRDIGDNTTKCEIPKKKWEDNFEKIKIKFTGSTN